MHNQFGKKSIVFDVFYFFLTFFVLFSLPTSLKWNGPEPYFDDLSMLPCQLHKELTQSMYSNATLSFLKVLLIPLNNMSMHTKSVYEEKVSEIGDLFRGTRTKSSNDYIKKTNLLNRSIILVFPSVSSALRTEYASFTFTELVVQQ